MIPYYTLIVIPLIPLLFRYKGIKLGKNIVISKNELSIGLFFFILIVFVSLRANTIGNDTRNYIYLFKSFADMSWKELFFDKEPAYAILNKLISYISTNPNVFFFFAALIYIIPIAILYIDNIEIPVLTIALFISMSTFVMLFSGIRQSIAIALGVISFYFTKNKKLIPFILVVLLAIMFHRSAFMLAFMYPLYHLRITSKWLLIVVPIMIIVFVLNKPIFSFLAIFLSSSYEVNVRSTGAYSMIILFALLSVFSYVVVDEEKMDKTTFGLRNFLLLATMLQMFAPLNSLAMRMNYYYIIFIPLLIPKIIKSTSLRWRQVSNFATYVMTVFFFIYFLFFATSANSLHTFPYQFFWEVA